VAGRKQFLLRIDQALYGELEAWAGAELRSVNAQMEFLLRMAVRQRKGPGTRPAAGAGEPSESLAAPDLADPRGGGQAAEESDAGDALPGGSDAHPGGPGADDLSWD
jgi:hypothetical protein